MGCIPPPAKIIQFVSLLGRSKEFELEKRCHIEVMPRLNCRAISVQALKEVVARVERKEREGQIPAWEEVASTDPIIADGDLPEPGSISSERDWPIVGAKELTLANGMKVSLVLQAS